MNLLNRPIDNEKIIVNSDVWAIGDVHGCAKEFQNLLEKIQKKSIDSYIYQLGDLIDRGPDLLEVFLLCSEYNVITLLGNHELNFLQEHLGGKPCRSLARQETHDLFNSYSSQDQDFILDIMCESLPYDCIRFIEQDHKWLLSHSPIKKFGLSPSFYCMNSSDTNYEVPEGHKSVHGHQHWNYKHISYQVGEDRNIFNVDGGVVYDEQLVALNLRNLDYLVENSVYKKL